MADRTKWAARIKLVAEREVAPFEVPEVSSLPLHRTRSTESDLSISTCVCPDRGVIQNSMHHRVSAYMQHLHPTLLNHLANLDRTLSPSSSSSSPTSTSIITSDPWSLPLSSTSSATGTSSVLSDGAIFAKATINTSIVTGRLPPRVVAQMRGGLSEEELKQVEDGEVMPYAACGISVTCHPRDPEVPSVQMNLRYFEAWQEDRERELGPVVAWFGSVTSICP